MPLNLIVVDTAAVSIKLRLQPVDNLGSTVDPHGVTIVSGSDYHVKDRVFLDRVDFTAFSDLSTPAQYVYHRLAITLPVEEPFYTRTNVLSGATNSDVTVLPTEEATTSPAGADPRRYIPLIPTTQPSIGSGATLSFTGARNSFTYTTTPTGILTSYLGTIKKNLSNVDRLFTFELQYQYDVMTGGVAVGVDQNAIWADALLLDPLLSPPPTKWFEYQQSTDVSIIVTAVDSLTYRFRTFRLPSATADANPTYDLVDQIYFASNNTNINPTNLVIGSGFSININGIVYYPEPAVIAETWLNSILWSDSIFNGTVNTTVDLVLVLADNSPSSAVDDLVTVTSLAKADVSAKEHIILHDGTTPKYLTASTSNTLKLFKGRTTRIYTDFSSWDDVSLTTFTLDPSDDEAITIGTAQNSLSRSGWTSFDAGQTVIGVSKTSSGRVYFLVYLGPNSTGVNFAQLQINSFPALNNDFSTFTKPAL